ncbi:MAG: DUF4190 domain-containing protein [Rothia sp. (in: high G+C Gram-positive bacteria)]|uniref:DUF4190 domain-containing protein n=1 Tax=Rothia sp. (in: high G+C Gram-positive bacteria) TaxID=1885016 RepID=UPI0026DF78C1|nr:DUF4190 domain-containing protein [Rothia sp. (in: high G+C Gram-positive bacteria)]MDO5750141.1 DUF4190 domain-containing protein [Rothia sp. (in: high G+C Gram-positive bacteria)]
MSQNPNEINLSKPETEAPNAAEPVFTPAEPQFVPAAPTAPAAPNPYAGGFVPSLSKGLAIAALVVGIIAFLTGLVPFLGGVLALVGLILGIVALVKVKKGTAAGKGMGITAIVLSSLALITNIIVIVLLFLGLAMVHECDNTAVKNADGTYTCTMNGQKVIVEKNGESSYTLVTTK